MAYTGPTRQESKVHLLPEDTIIQAFIFMRISSCFIMTMPFGHKKYGNWTKSRQTNIYPHDVSRSLTYPPLPGFLFSVVCGSFPRGVTHPTVLRTHRACVPTGCSAWGFERQRPIAPGSKKTTNNNRKQRCAAVLPLLWVVIRCLCQPIKTGSEHCKSAKVPRQREVSIAGLQRSQDNGK